MQTSTYCGYNVGLPHKASWHAYIMFAVLTIPASSSYISARMSAKSHQSAAVLTPVPYFRQNAACTLSLQGVRLCQAALCQPDIDQSVHGCSFCRSSMQLQKCSAWQYTSVQAMPH